jgi:hypothetical protein
LRATNAAWPLLAGWPSYRLFDDLSGLAAKASSRERLGYGSACFARSVYLGSEVLLLPLLVCLTNLSIDLLVLLLIAVEGQSKSANGNGSDH